MLLCNILALSSSINILGIDAKSAMSLPSGTKLCFNSQKVTPLILNKTANMKTAAFLFSIMFVDDFHKVFRVFFFLLKDRLL